jgi:hypothetical protein
MKMEINREELLKEAKRRYPLNTRIIDFNKTKKGKDIIRIVKEFDSVTPIEFYIVDDFEGGFNIHTAMYCLDVKGRYVSSNPTVYENGKWVEIVKDDTILELKDKLDKEIDSVKGDVFSILMHNKTCRKIFGHLETLEYRGLKIYRSKDIEENIFNIR